jgi:small acid-soluble spore protein H (minor)
MNEIFILAKNITINILGVKKMNENRVKQILSSSAEIEVKYNGASVWIDQLNEDGRTATVHLRGPLEERTIVEIAELQEE